jgi:hypothetical protein
MIRRLIILLLIVGCGLFDYEEEEEYFCCEYEKRQRGCGGTGASWTPWVAKSTEFKYDEINKSASDVCASYDESTTTCGAGCCVDFQRRNPVLVDGECEW